MKVSFDFDSTLDEHCVQDMARKFIFSGCEVHITTSRCKGNNIDLYHAAGLLGIPDSRIHFTEGAYKAETLKLIGADVHFDDMEDECDLINRETECKAVLVGFDRNFIGYLFNEEEKI